jgi:glutamyl-tRNA reductase
MANVDVQSLHLLSIELASAPSSLRALLSLQSDDVEHWLRRARATGVPLAIVVGPGRVDLYSSHEGRRAAFKPLLESLWSLARNLDGFERIRTIEASGHAVVRHLLRQAAGLESTEHGLSYAGCIAHACAQAARHDTLSDVLRELFQLATTTADRSRAETELSAPHATRASRQIEALSAERIMEEELTAFRVAALNDEHARKESTRPSGSSPPFPVSEPGSATRLRVAPISLGSVSQRRSG